jgi:hypothetical protein
MKIKLQQGIVLYISFVFAGTYIEQFPTLQKVITNKQKKIMRTKIFFLFAMLVSVAANATVTVTPISTDYAAKKVTFKVAWTNSPTAPYNNRVWIWIDFCPVNGVTLQSFSTATITSPTKSGSGTITGLNGRGFFIEYAATNAGTTVTATLSNASGKFNWCVYGSDYPPNATVANGTYTLKGTSPFIVNGTMTLGAGAITYSGGCITSLTDQTGCPGIINYASISAGAINSSSTIVRTNVTPAAITSNTAASSGGGITYRWVRSGTSSATYTNNNVGHSFTTAEINTAGTWTYYREVRDNTCSTTTWSRSSGSYILTVIACPYTGSDLYLTSSYPCQQRTSGAKNWEAYIKDSQDGQIYRITQFSDNSWWFAEDFNRNTNVKNTCGGKRYYSINNYPTGNTGWNIPTQTQIKSRWPCPPSSDQYGGPISVGYAPYSGAGCYVNEGGRFDIVGTGCTNTIPVASVSGYCWSCNAVTDIWGRIRFRRQL